MSRKDATPETRTAIRDNEGPGRREFLKAAGVVGLGAAAAPLAAGTAKADESPEEQVASRYRLTEHVKRFYFLNSL